MAIGGTALAFIAGVLSVLSPCVLPILPIVLGAAASKHRLGPMVAIGAVLMLPPLQARLAVASGPIAAWTDQRFGQSQGNRLSSQFWIGALLGVVWSPCVGPTLGAASLLAAQGRELLQVGITMFAFGVGAALPLLVLGIVSREAVLRWRHLLLSAGHGVKTAFGLFFVVIGGLVLLGLDKSIETVLVNASPEWLTNLTTRF
jgi:cytochrome c-type biogenesis protein